MAGVATETGSASEPIEQATAGAVDRVAVALGLGASSASGLIFEIVLTRVFAITQFHHFAFVTVGLALLGFGASGSLLAAFPRLGRGGPRRWALIAGLQAIATVTAYGIVNRVPFDSFSIAFETTQIWLLVFNYLVVALPFLFGGALVAILLAGWDQDDPIPSNHVYAYSLVGAGVGCGVALGALPVVGGVGVIFLAAVFAIVAAVAFSLALRPPKRWITAALTAGAAILGLAVAAPPSAFDLRLSEYKDLSAALRFPGAEVASVEWSAAARVDYVASSGIRSVPGLSFTYPGSPPPQHGLTFDGDDLSPVPLVGPDDGEFARYVLGSLPFRLRPAADVAVLQPRGGLDVLVGLVNGASAVTAVEPDGTAVAAVGREGFDIYADPRVEVVTEEPRVYLERTDRRFDVIDVALTAPYRPVSSGAYSLAEDYLLTAEAFATYLNRLEPDGILSVARWLQLPPSEETRLVALAAGAVRQADGDPAESVAVLRTYALVLVLAKPAGFTTSEVEVIRSFAEELRFDVVALPGLDPSDTNRFNRLPDDEYHRLATALLGTGDPSTVYDASAFDISPPTDDRPFFAHFFKWSQTSEVLDSFGRTWQPFGGAGYFVVLAVLAVATATSLLLIIGPLLFLRAGSVRASSNRAWTLGYFGLLGVAFLFVEIPIIQRYILLVGQPTTALAVVLFSILVASGVGSLSARSIPWLATALVLAATAAAYTFALPMVTGWLLPLPFAGRVIGGVVVLFPLGFLMGTMFPNGVAHLEATSPALVPWAWGINGLTSVVSATGAILVALSFGFSAVIGLGAAGYGLATILTWRAIRGSPAGLTAVTRPG